MAFARSPIAYAELVKESGSTVTLDRLHKRGYEALLTYYDKIALSRLVG